MKPNRMAVSEHFFPFFLLLLTFAIYWPALRVFFSLDDLNFLLRASGLENDPLRISRLISTQLFFRAGWTLFGARPWPYHLVAFIIHAANAWILYSTALRLGLQKSSAFAASVLFVAAPVAFHPLYWISGIQEVSAAFFALLAVYFFLDKGSVTIAYSLIAAGLSLLCKETSFLLLPLVALIRPVSSRRRVIVGIGGLLLGAAILAASGKLTPRSAGNPYETAFGMNIVWNLLTYSAWLIRLQEFFPDRIPQYDTNLAAWGLILPALLCLSARFFRKSRRSIVQASILFLALLAPVLPLIRHSYFYYLYIPLIPFWLLAGGMLAKISRRRAAVGILTIFVCHSLMYGKNHRTIEIADGVLEDPFLRYAAITGSAVQTFGAMGEIKRGDYLFIIHRSADSIDLTRGQTGKTDDRLKHGTLFESALFGGRGLRLFFPEMQNVNLEYAAGYVPGWQDMHIYWVSNAGWKYMGYGEKGRMNIIEASMKNGGYDRAQREINIMLDLRPNDPVLVFLLGTIAFKQGHEASLNSILKLLEDTANMENPPGLATEAFNTLKKAAGLP